jgi:hypothetical protein
MARSLGQAVAELRIAPGWSQTHGGIDQRLQMPLPRQLRLALTSHRQQRVT